MRILAPKMDSPMVTTPTGGLSSYCPHCGLALFGQPMPWDSLQCVNAAWHSPGRCAATPSASAPWRVLPPCLSIVVFPGHYHAVLEKNWTRFLQENKLNWIISLNTNNFPPFLISRQVDMAMAIEEKRGFRLIYFWGDSGC